MRGRITALMAALAAGCVLVCLSYALRGDATDAVAIPSGPPRPAVRAIFQRDCAVCHGSDARGTALGPDLHGTGAAQVDFQLSTGRMPVPTGDASASRQRPSYEESQARRPAKYDDATRRALVGYVVGLAGGGGPAIPDVHAGAGDLAQGGELFRLQCAACHAWSGDGGALLQREAPPIQPASALQIAEAVRVGPGNMPAFGRAALDQKQLQSLVRYAQYLDHPTDRGGTPLWHLGPLAEGAVAVFVGLGLLVVAVRWIGTRS